MSYLLDTNVVSEVRRPRAARPVVAWFDSVPSGELFVSVLVLGEIRRGIERLRRRGDEVQAIMFQQWLSEVRERFADRVVSIDAPIAEEWGRIDAAAPTPVEDALMAATAKVRGFVLVTRNTSHVVHTGVRVLNPWEQPPG